MGGFVGAIALLRHAQTTADGFTPFLLQVKEVGEIHYPRRWLHPRIEQPSQRLLFAQLSIGELSEAVFLARYEIGSTLPLQGGCSSR